MARILDHYYPGTSLQSLRALPGISPLSQPGSAASSP